MKHIDIFNAYPVVKELKGFRFDGVTALKLNRLEKELREIYEFQQEEYRKIYVEYKPEYDQKTSQLRFKTAQACNAFVKATEELDKLEYEVKNAPVRVPIEKVPEVSGDDMDKVEGLIEFYEEPEPEIQIQEVQPEDIPEDAEMMEMGDAENIVPIHTEGTVQDDE